MKLHLNYEAGESGGHALSNDAWADYSDTVRTFAPLGLYLNRNNVPGWRNETVETRDEFRCGDVAFMVVVRYSDGDTLGSSTGNWSIWGIYRDAKDAMKQKGLIEADARSGASGDMKGREDAIGLASTNPHHSLYDWRGYFNSLENVEIHTMAVL